MAINKNQIIFGLSMFSFVFGTIAVDYSIYIGDIGSAFWFCYIALILFGLGGILRSPTLILSQLQIIFVPVLIWLTDFLFLFFTNKSWWGISNYFFDSLTPLARLISLEHFFIIPLGFTLLLLLPKPYFFKATIISITQTILTFVSILLFTQVSDNANCAFYSCVSIIPNSIYYPIIWFALMFSMIFIGHMCVRVFYLLFK